LANTRIVGISVDRAQGMFTTGITYIIVLGDSEEASSDVAD